MTPPFYVTPVICGSTFTAKDLACPITLTWYLAISPFPGCVRTASLPTFPHLLHLCRPMNPIIVFPYCQTQNPPNLRLLVFIPLSPQKMLKISSPA